jgi:hypothetical protein
MVRAVGVLYRLRPERVEWRVVDDEVIAIDLGASEYITVNAVGTRLWPLLADGSERDQLVATLQQDYDVERSRLEADVDEFLGTLEARGLIDASARD